MTDDSKSIFDGYSRGVLLALTDALTLLAASGPQATIAAASVPVPETRDSVGKGKRDGWQRAALIIRAAQANELLGQARVGAQRKPSPSNEA